MRFSSDNSYKRHDYSTNIGLSSLLLIFTVLCLVSFATLSLASTYADKRLNEKIVTNTKAYYNACNSAQEKLASIDSALCSLYNSGLSETEYYDKAGKSITFVEPVTDTQSLNIKLNILYPESISGPFYEIKSWSTVTTQNLELDTKLPVYK